MKISGTLSLVPFLLAACSSSDGVDQDTAPVPTRVIDLTLAITSDQPVRTWGRRMLTDFGFRETNDFEFVINRDPVYASNSYWTLFNHTGAHLDSPSHMIEGAQTIDVMPLESLIGKGRLLDFRHKGPSETISLDEIRGAAINPGEIALLLVGYGPPTGEQDLPAYPALSPEAADYLAQLPVQAIGTDGFSVESVARMYEAIGNGESGNEAITPIHYSFFRRNIPVFEVLTNLDELVGVDSFVFVGFPLKVEGSDGSPIRAAALIYQ